MDANFLRKGARPLPALCCAALGIILILQSIPLYAHSGASVAAPTEVSTTININGTIDSSGTEAVWAPGLPMDGLPNNCGEFNGVPPPPQVNMFALNDGVNLFLAFDIPDTSANANDALCLFFDPNHGGGGAPAVDDRAFLLTFNNVAANNAVPAAQVFSGTGAGWGPPAAALPAGVLARYTRQAAGAGSWQIEMQFPFTGPTIGFAFLYLNETGGAGADCDGDGEVDDFDARFPSTLPVAGTIVLPAGIANPGQWGNLDFGPQPPTVRFQPPLCCGSADISFLPSANPFTAGVPVNIFARVHNLHATSTANNVNVEIRVHNFGTGGTVVSPFPLQTVVPSINPTSTPPSFALSNAVIWPSPPAGLHGCIRAEIKPPTVSQYFIDGGNATAQHNIDVKCVPRGLRKEFAFVTFNPEQQRELRIRLAMQTLLPRGFDGLRFEVQQPDRPLRGQEEFPVRLIVTAANDAHITDVPHERVTVQPTSGGTAVPPLRNRSGTDPIHVAVKSGDRLHFAATGEVDLDGGGPAPGVGPDGGDLASSIGADGGFLLRGDGASRQAGALIGSFDGFRSSFVIGSEITFTVPEGTERLSLAVNDVDGGFGNNTGNGFDVHVATLPPLDAPDVLARRAEAAEVTIPQVNITATSTDRVTIGQTVYNLLSNHGGVTYQLLVVDERGATGTTGMPGGMNRWIIYVILLLLALLLLFFWWRSSARRKRAS